VIEDTLYDITCSIILEKNTKSDENIKKLIIIEEAINL
jgi:hypothetical protein